MKIKIISIIFILFLSFVFTFKADAACCVKSCSNPNNEGKCVDNSTPDQRECYLIPGCAKSDPKATEPATTAPTAASTATTEFVNPIGFKSVSQMLNAVLGNLMGLILIVAVIFIVLGGIMYLLSGGNEEMVTRAKKTWTGAIIGLAIALAAPTFLKEIQALLGGGTGADAESWVSNALTFRQIAANVLNWLLSIFGIIAVISLIIGGGMYLTAYGDQTRIDKAKSIITYAILGIVVALSALIIVRQLGNLLGAQF